MDKKPSFKTFHYNELIIELHHEAYEASEDTFQLLESIEVNEDDTVLEIGTGCGLIALECARQGAKVVCTDINPYAIELVKRNYLRNQPMLKCTSGGKGCLYGYKSICN
jgi:release factor glutamine methyltransferase